MDAADLEDHENHAQIGSVNQDFIKNTKDPIHSLTYSFIQTICIKLLYIISCMPGASETVITKRDPDVLRLIPS